MRTQQRTEFVEPLPGSGMRGDDQRQFVLGGQRVEQGHEPFQCARLVHVFLAMAAHDKVSSALQAETFENRRRADFRQVMVEYFVHGAPGLDDAVRRQPLAQQVFPGNRTIGHVDIAGMVHDAPIDLLGRAVVEAAVSGLHVKHRNPPPLGGQGGQGAVGVPQDQDRVRPELGEQAV